MWTNVSVTVDSYFCVKSTPWYLSYLQTLLKPCTVNYPVTHAITYTVTCVITCRCCWHILRRFRGCKPAKVYSPNALNNSTSNYQNHYLWVFFKFNCKINLLLLSTNFQNYRFSEKAEKIVKDILIFYQDTELQLFTNQSTVPAQIWV